MQNVLSRDMGTVTHIPRVTHSNQTLFNKYWEVFYTCVEGWQFHRFVSRWFDSGHMLWI